MVPPVRFDFASLADASSATSLVPCNLPPLSLGKPEDIIKTPNSWGKNSTIIGHGFALRLRLGRGGVDAGVVALGHRNGTARRDHRTRG